jgi:maltooligosyltrehalose trehalohydrolase
VLDWHRRLIALRLSEPDLLSHDRRLVGTAFDEEARWLVVNRGRFSIAANLADKRQPLPLDGGASVVMASDEGVEVETSDEGASVWLPPRSVAVLAH